MEGRRRASAETSVRAEGNESLGRIACLGWPNYGVCDTGSHEETGAKV
jgi:hypothetical protein